MPQNNLRGTRRRPAPARHSAARARRAWYRDERTLRGLAFVGGIIFAGLLIVALVRGLSQGTAPASASCGNAGKLAAGSSSDSGVVVCDGQPTLHTYDAADVGLMSPAIDANGAMWVGAMAKNGVVEFNTRTGQSRVWGAPDGKNLIMETAIDTHGNVWYAEQGAGYVGRLDPTTGQTTQFPSQTADGKRQGAQALWFDQRGGLWLSVPSGGWIGRLDPAIGQISAYRVPERAAGVKMTPYDLALAPDGRVWFGCLDGGAVGDLNRATGKVTLHPLKDPSARVYAIAPDSAGRVWFTELSTPRIGYVDAKTGAVREIDVPTALGKPETLYGIAADGKNNVWFSSYGTHAIIRYTPGEGVFTFFKLPIGKDAPYELTFDQQGRLWFTTQGDTPSYIGMLTP